MTSKIAVLLCTEVHFSRQMMFFWHISVEENLIEIDKVPWEFERPWKLREAK